MYEDMEIKEKTFYFSKNDILSGIAKWGVAQSPYHRPANLEVVLDKLNKKLTPLFKRNKFNWKKMSYEKIKEFIFKHATSIPEFVAWNEPKLTGWSGYVTGHSDIKPDYDFIDLHALVRNVTNDIVRSGHETPIPLILNQGVIN